MRTGAIIGFILGFGVGLAGWVILLPTDPIVKVQTQVIRHTVPGQCPPAPRRVQTTSQCLSPAYVLDLMKDCRAGRLNQTDADVTLRQ